MIRIKYCNYGYRKYWREVLKGCYYSDEVGLEKRKEKLVKTS